MEGVLSPHLGFMPKDLFLAHLIDSEPKNRSCDEAHSQQWDLHICNTPILVIPNMYGLLGLGGFGDSYFGIEVL
jgi:hypothetical protein